jgi:hypothetical protein
MVETLSKLSDARGPIGLTDHERELLSEILHEWFSTPHMTASLLFSTFHRI